MKILLTGGGTGGHFYPLIAIAEEINKLVDKEKILDVKLYYMSDAPYDKRMLFENNIEFVGVPAGKMRTYSSILNFLDLFKTATGLFYGLIRLFSIYPDVVISKGGYASFPAVFAAKILRIPVIVHESDSSAGRLNLWASKFAKRIAVSYPEAGEQFPKDKTAWVGQPVRREVSAAATTGMFEFFKLSRDVQTIFVVGGSQGAEIINSTLIEALPDLISKYQIIHQAGPKNFEEVKLRSDLMLEKNPYKARYIVYPYLNNLTTKMAAGAATLVISRAGSTIFEIAAWGVPSIIIPITNSNGDHQRKNAFSYARAGACDVLEEANLTPHVLVAEIDKLMNNTDRLNQMKEKAKAFSTPDAATKIAQEAIDMALAHEA
ncbi:MAG: undecaprenyldiphospho-muramoylpentapeptide beta-N-acetylglucosaminyltransferase [Candidatus Pacebacteria bacterium]|nr:undecaprenyldiphospho-muramoylpentapeptide beta-N-acetylglucosaminyltransferase [Candidatus Paceibacterota bacterium]MBP9715606.1 undecaprenyldiphospho-muramoylpentapeptide beta-N-acetylglucosaminyltransferase [Candidatus Paceibacterota bacterium]